MRRIPFGIHHFTRRTLSKEEAGFINTMPAVLQLEYIQYYFHIYLVPVIPTSAGWYARYEDGTLEKLEGDMVKQLSDIYHPRFSLWACMGPLMLIAALALAFLGRVIVDYYGNFDSFNNSPGQRKELFSYLMEPAVGDYYLFDSKAGSWGAGKVTDFNEDTIELSILHLPDHEWEDETLINDFKRQGNVLPVVRVSKTVLAKMVDMQANADTALIGIKLNQCRLTEVRHIAVR
jgi:hypothetical protein